MGWPKVIKLKNIHNIGYKPVLLTWADGYESAVSPCGLSRYCSARECETRCSPPAHGPDWTCWSHRILWSAWEYPWYSRFSLQWSKFTQHYVSALIIVITAQMIGYSQNESSNLSRSNKTTTATLSKTILIHTNVIPWVILQYKNRECDVERKRWYIYKINALSSTEVPWR